ncbi:hypothetical protein G7Y89_g14362 [Cudoniella acicularis]|uniref:Clr5 domain-containing protein n=1 Tax=Cudoniella acicularis TaxID=354080 RepID=A0A8H4VW89_9HELO|nr:hypothetical protein G7Y89_g14362 [Cudoniella acicularis]
MNSINSLLSPEGYDWGMPSMSNGLSQEHAGPSDTSVQPHGVGFHPYESFNPMATNPPQIPAAFPDVNPRFPSPQDVPMEEQVDAQQENSGALPDAPQPSAPRRSRNGSLELEGHKEVLKRLYLTENKSLKEVMGIMKEEYSLPESTKRYKEKFEAWGWRKNLPGEYAQWMAQKANKRKREDGKETVFHYGGLRWNKADAEKSATRSKKARNRAETSVVETPSEIDYQTPRNVAISPQNALSPPRNTGKGKQAAQAQSEPEDEDEDEENDLSISWRGHSREQLISIFESARSHAENQSNRAEELFSTALEGYGHLLGATHEEAVKVAFAMASFYTEQGRSADADRVIEEVCRCHISKFGIEDRRTQQLILQIVEILNGWNRGTDALAFLARSKDLAETETVSTTRKTQSRRRGKTAQTQKAAPGNDLLDIAQDIVSTKSAARVDYGIGVARTHVAANDAAVEAFLQAIIHHCSGDLEALEIQNLKARSELLKFYNKTNQNLEQRATFLNAIEAATAVILRKTWDKQSFRSFEVLEALLELSASILKGSFEIEAWGLFNQIEHKTEDDFGWDEERTIWAKINIGIIYERNKGWEYAKSWFNHAYAASIAANGDEDGITKALQVALDKRHFSYLSDEGRPFKSIFGVSGITFRPARLHID